MDEDFAKDPSDSIVGIKREVGGNLERLLSLLNSSLTVAPPTFPVLETGLLTGLEAEFRTMRFGLFPLCIRYTPFPGSTT
jgi:hypothetical protein